MEHHYNHRRYDGLLIALAAALLILVLGAQPGEGDQDALLAIEAPESVIVRSTDPVSIPIVLRNNDELLFSFITLSAAANDSSLVTYFDVDVFEELLPGGSEASTLIIEGQKLEQTYEVTIFANASDYGTKKTIMLMPPDDTEVRIKLAFAKDLLREQPTCQLYEPLLEQARNERQRLNIGEASQLADAFIRHCRKLVSLPEQQEPKRLVVGAGDVSLGLLGKALLATFTFAGAIFLIYHYTNKEAYEI